MHKEQMVWQKILSPGSHPLFCLASLALALCGCGSPKTPFKESVMAPEPPAFLTDGAAALLTRPGSWTARITLTTGAQPHPNTRTGLLFIKGDRMFFAQDKSDRSFIWDSSNHRGIILSEALQGYAPFQAEVYPSILSTKSETAGGESARVNGYAGHEAEISALMSDTTTATFQLWKADALDGFPARVTVPAVAGTNGTPGTPASRGPVVVDILDMRKAVVSDNLFSPPEGFTAYRSSAAMTSEYMMRHSKTSDARPASGDDDVPTGSSKVHAPPRGGGF